MERADQLRLSASEAMDKNVISKDIQKVLHLYGPVVVLVQWYTILFIGSGLLVMRTFGWCIGPYMLIRHAKESIARSRMCFV